MPNQPTKSSFRDKPKSIAKWKSCQINLLATASLLLFLSQSLGAQGAKEFIYGPDGKMIATVSAEPTWLRFNATQGFAGINTAQVSVGNGAGMTVGLKYQFIGWGDQTPALYQSQIGPLAADGPISVNGWIVFPIPQDSAPGTITVTAIRNANGGDWIQLNPPSSYTVRPPKPVLNTFVSPATLQLPAQPGTQQAHSANLLNQTIAINMNLPQGSGAYYVPLDGGGDWHSGPLTCGVQSGSYSFISARNSLDSNSDAVALWGSITSGALSETVVPCQ
jgi:hypothetical protein